HVSNVLSDVRLSPSIGPAAIKAVIAGIPVLEFCRDQVYIVASHPHVDGDVLALWNIPLSRHPVEKIVVNVSNAFASLCLEGNKNNDILATHFCRAFSERTARSDAD